MDSETELEFISLITDITFLASSSDWDSEVSSLFTQLFSVDSFSDEQNFIHQIYSLNRKVEFISLIDRIIWLERKRLHLESKLVSILSQIIFFVSLMDLDSESELISLIKQIISLFNSKPDSELELVSLITRLMRLHMELDSEPTQESELLSLVHQLVSLKPEMEFISLIKRIISHFKSMNWEPKQFLFLCPQVKVQYEQGKFHVVGDGDDKKEECGLRLDFFRSSRKDYFHCLDCDGEDHEEENEKAPVEVKHTHHPKHSLQLVLLSDEGEYMERQCYCCEEYLKHIFYYCSGCDFAMNIACVEKPSVLSIDYPKWHEHTLVLFSRHTSLTCDVCALTHSTSPFYICPPCGFVVHQRCINLPRVIRISRHPHRISFTSSFDKGVWFCGVCRKKIDNDYGGYSCIKEACSYAAHSRCATQRNVWDGIELEGVPEEIEEEVEPFVRISDGIIQHFSHQQHHLKLDKNTNRDYDENKQCQACLTPIYFGNFYSCIECDLIIHEECANLPRKIYHPTHPHMLTLEGRYDNVIMDDYMDRCSTCAWICTGGFFYKCGKEECSHFKLHVQCATILEPLVHESHMHPLFLTSKPGEKRECGVCENVRLETFNCIECSFALCFACATIPHEVRYKHDKHILTLSYEEETSTMKTWCEACEKSIKPKKRFYT